MRTGLRVAIALLLLAPLPVAFLASVGVRMLGAGLMLQTATFIAAAALLGWAEDQGHRRPRRAGRAVEAKALMPRVRVLIAGGLLAALLWGATSTPGREPPSASPSARSPSTPPRVYPSQATRPQTCPASTIPIRGTLHPASPKSAAG